MFVKRFMCLVVMLVSIGIVGCSGEEKAEEGEGAEMLDPDKMMDSGTLPDEGPDGKARTDQP